MAKAIYQLVAGFRRGDAISNESLLMRFHFRAWGYPSEIACASSATAPSDAHEVISLEELRARLRPEDMVILHLSIGCEANDLFPQLNCQRVILYHNITPAHFFERLDSVSAAHLAHGRLQAKALAGSAHINLADSAYNASELTEMGYANPSVLPLLIDLQGAHQKASPTYASRYEDGALNVLFVGRVAPNKRHDELLRVFHDLQHYVEPFSRLLMAGSYAGAEAYHTLLLGQAYALELKRVIFTDGIPQCDLNACYRAATVFLCMSEHEGFCAPLLEAMHHDLPVVAVGDAAIPETMGGAGVLFRERNYPLIAETIAEIAHNPALRQSIINGQHKRLAAYHARNFEAELKTALAL